MTILLFVVGLATSRVDPESTLRRVSKLAGTDSFAMVRFVVLVAVIHRISAFLRKPQAT